MSKNNGILRKKFLAIKVFLVYSVSRLLDLHRIPIIIEEIGI